MWFPGLTLRLSTRRGAADGPGCGPHGVLPLQSLIGRSNPVALPVRFWVEDGVVHGRATFGPLYCGAPDLVHGGVVAAVMDELLGVANVVNGRGAMTGTLTIRYLKPTPLFERYGWRDAAKNRMDEKSMPRALLVRRRSARGSARNLYRGSRPTGALT